MAIDPPRRPDPGEVLRTNPNPGLAEVELRRYLIGLERSLNEGTQWAVFEPNGEALWARVRTAIADFLTNEWRSGRLLGATADQAFYVRCDQSTMTQNDIDNGRLTCIIGVAPVKPAEFIIINISQWTSAHKPNP
jgi:hypothetical protein